MSVSTKRFQVVLLALVLPFLCFGSHAEAQPREGTPTVAVVVDGPSDWITELTQQLAVESDALLGGRYPGFRFPRAPSHVGQYTPESVDRVLREALESEEFDFVVGIGVLTGRSVASIEPLPKPVLLPFAAPALEGLPQRNGVSGRKNLAYIQSFMDLPQELRRFREVIRRDSAVLLFDSHLTRHAPQLVEFVKATSTDREPLLLQGAGGSAEQILSSLPPGTQAVYLGPLLQLPGSETQALIDGLNARRIPTYASQGTAWVERGAMVTLVARDRTTRRARRMALMLQEILDGAEPSSLGTRMQQQEQLLINMATARAVGISPSFALLTEAELLGEGAEHSNSTLTLRAAVARALKANLALSATRRDADIAGQRIREARGALLPAVDLSGDYTWLDPDAANSLANAERTLRWGLSGRQLVYSPRALPSLRSAKKSRDSVVEGVRASELDLILETARAYLNVLRARTAEAVQRSNLDRIRQNLTAAEDRVAIGAATRQEVHRWRIEIANGRASVISANAQRNQAEIALNRLLNEPLEASFRAAEPLAPEAGIVISDRAREFIGDRATFRLFRDFLAREALANAPELPQLKRALEAQDAVLQAERQALLLPDISVSAGFTNTLSRRGAGAQDAANVPRPDLFWQAGAGLSFRLFDSTRYGTIERTRLAVSQLQLQRGAAALAIEQRVRSALHRAGASNASVALRQDAAEAATDNLEMVTDAYQQGAVSLITLVDAQDSALQTRLAAANAMYDFLVDYVEVERAVGRFNFFRTPAERAAFLGRMESFIQSARQGPDGPGSAPRQETP